MNGTTVRNGFELIIIYLKYSIKKVIADLEGIPCFIDGLPIHQKAHGPRQVMLAWIVDNFKRMIGFAQFVQQKYKHIAGYQAEFVRRVRCEQ